MISLKLVTKIEILSYLIVILAYVIYGTPYIDKFLFLLYYILLIYLDWQDDKKINIYRLITRLILITFIFSSLLNKYYENTIVIN